LTKTILEIIIAFYNYSEKLKRERLICEDLKHYIDEQIVWDTEAYVLCRELITTRNERRIHKVEASIYICRMLMLISSLRVRGHEYLNPIFISICGLTQASANVFKSTLGKANITKLTIEEVNAKQSEKSKRRSKK
jgi:hypothetical protein